MAPVMDRVPAIGDVLALPTWMRVGPYRVLDVARDPIPGWVVVDGYEIDLLPRTETTHRVPLILLRLLPDPTCEGTP